MSPKPITENTLFYGDNLFILRELIASESVDLISSFILTRRFNKVTQHQENNEWN